MSSSYDPNAVAQEGNSIIYLVQNSIEYHRPDDLDAYLKQIPLLTLDVETSYSLLELFLMKAFDEDNLKAAAILVKAWADTNPEEDIRPTILHIFRIDGFPPGLYGFVMKNYPRLTFSDMMIKLNNFDHEIPTIQAAHRINQHFGPQNMETYEEILADLADSQESPINPVVYSAIESIMKDANTANVRAKPTWVIPPPFLVNGGLPSQDELVEWANKHVDGLALNDDGLDTADPTKLARYLVELYQGISGRPDTFSIMTHLHPEPMKDAAAAMSVIAEHLSQAEFSETRTDIIAQIRATNQSSLTMDPFLFRVFGSSYFSQGDRLLDSKSEDPCLRYGGCRTMLCWEYDNVDSDDDEIIPDIHQTHEYGQLEWFTGVCQQCGIRILQKHYARRMPMFDGGWSGCYCDEVCLLNNTYSDEDTRIPNIKRDTEMLEALGVYDRIWPAVKTKPFKYISPTIPTPPLDLDESVSLSMFPSIFIPTEFAQSSFVMADM